MKKLVLFLSLSLLCSTAFGQLDTRNIIGGTQAVFDSLPTSGEEWGKIVAVIGKDTSNPQVINQDDPTDQYVLAKALYWRKFPSEIRYRNEVIAACNAAIDTEKGGRTLALGRNLYGYVVAADLVGFRGTDFMDWTRECLTEVLGSGVARDLKTTAYRRPNNWGRMCIGSWLAVAAYLEDDVELTEAAAVFKGHLYDLPTFSFGDLSWQPDPSNPVAVGPVGSLLNGHPASGIVPDDQRRKGSFTWPPTKVNYVYEGLQGLIAGAVILANSGYPDVWNWEDKSIFRQYAWLEDQADFPCTDSDDSWQTHIVNFYYPERDFVAPTSATFGKIFGWTSWFYSKRSGVVNPPDPPPTANTLVVSPTNLSFTFEIGGSIPANKSLSITSTNPLAFSVLSSQPWTTTDKTSGTTPDTISVGINPSGLAVGTHTSTIFMNAPDSDNDVVEVSVSLVVTEKPIVDPPTDPPSSIIDAIVINDLDDVEERSDGSISYKDGDLIVGNKEGNRAAGVRILSLNISQGATVKKAELVFTVNEEGSGNLLIFGQAADNAPQFTTAVKFNVTARPKTIAKTEVAVNWNQEKVQQRIDVTAIVQEIVNRSGWVPGGAMVFIISGTGTMVADSWGGVTTTDAIVLHVEL